jgi:hypothetical protein
MSRVPQDLNPRVTVLARPAAIVNDRPILSLERMLHSDYNRKCSVEKYAGRESQGVCRQDELIGGRPPVVKYK